MGSICVILYILFIIAKIWIKNITKYIMDDDKNVNIEIIKTFEDLGMSFYE